jgi:hypothetical protein
MKMWRMKRKEKQQPENRIFQRKFVDMNSNAVCK